MKQWIVLDGCDGIGKTEQIKVLKSLFESRGEPVVLTRSLGGPVGSYLEPMRDFIFHSKLSPFLEEELIALSARLNLDLFEKPSEVINILQDRGLASHLAYSALRGFNATQTKAIYQEVIDLNFYSKIKNIVLLPDKMDWLMERIEARSVKNNFNDFYESKSSQEFIVNELKQLFGGQIHKYGNFSLIIVKKKDKPHQIHEKICKILDIP